MPGHFGDCSLTPRDRRRSRAVGLVVAALSLSTAAAAAATVGPAASVRHGSAPVLHSAGPASKGGGFAGAINTHDRGAVNRAYLARFGPNLTTAIHWTGNNPHCRAGHPSPKAHHATLESLNFVRALGHLAPVSYNRALSHHAQKAALIMSANNALSHTPPHNWKCWTREGANAAGHSNLAISWPQITAGGLVEQYMDDSGSGNEVVGHRRWIMNPPATQFGSGTTSTANALWVLGPARDSRPNPEFVGWPTAGWFPSPLEPGGRWSLSAGDDSTDFSHARVTVRTAGGAGRQVHRYSPVPGYAKPTLAWQVSNISPTGTYRVTVKGIRVAGRAAPFPHSYTVRMFTPSR